MEKRETRLLSEPILETKVSHTEFQFVPSLERNARDAFFSGKKNSRIHICFFFARKLKSDRGIVEKEDTRRIIVENQYRFIYGITVEYKSKLEWINQYCSWLERVDLLQR